jgi:phosphotransacetylase
MESTTPQSIKAELINLILEINDHRILEKVKSLIKSESDKGIYILNEEQKERVKKAVHQYENNETIDNQTVHEEITKWLSEK